ncbi:MAG TPA: AbrB/MazE/SpoVT family DNA-binding domain-containing protein [Dehalococcoidia bacterium]|nr:AbrB/MazE/SpoVT family DNA-binding domain-containing protein [Dehalococcoidia bacterium]
MREFVSTITTKGQVTIPVEIRRLLGVGPYDKVAFVVEHDQVRLKPTRSVVERTAGALQGKGPVLTAEQLREEAERAMAEGRSSGSEAK